MNIGMELYRAQNRFMSLVQSQQTSKMALEMFLTPRRHGLKNWEVEAEHSGTRMTLAGGISVIRWGKGIPILMVHGWEARATQMASFVPPLVQAGYEVIAIDAPAHGMSLGKHSHPMKFVEAIFAAERAFGPFYAVIGHSMGGGSSIYSVAEGLQTDKLISISAPASFKRACARFGQFIGLDQDTKSRFLKRVEHSVGLSFDAIDLVKKAQQITIPTLIIHDQRDKEIPTGDANELHNAMANSRLYKSHNLGHRKIMRDTLVVDATTLFIQQSGARFLEDVI